MSCREGEFPPLLADYVLELLPGPEAQRIEQHLASCEPCRLAVGRERALAQAVRESVQAATKPSAPRLHALMPAPPIRRARPLLLWQPVAALALMAILFLGSLQMNDAGASYALPTASNTALVATATQTPVAGATETPRIQAHLSRGPVTEPTAILLPAAAPRPAYLP